jgi:hypothetical protein
VASEVVATIRANGTGRHLVLRNPDVLVTALWSPSGRSIAIDCPEPLAWVGADQSPLVIATGSMGCVVEALDRHGRLLRRAELDPNAQVLYSIDAASGVHVLRVFNSEYEMIAVLPRGEGIVAALWPRLYLIRFDGSAPVPLPPLVAPPGMRLGRDVFSRLIVAAR